MRHFGGEPRFWLVYGIWGLPGAFVAMIFARGNVHGADLCIIELGNFAFYFGIAYLILTLWQRRKRKGNAHS
jgi:hypothetical protein